MANRKKPADGLDIYDFVERICRDMETKEEREGVVYHVPKEQAAMAYIIRALANPRCEGSREVLEAIQRRREVVLQEQVAAHVAAQVARMAVASESTQGAGQ
jgi:hypothetical protein